MCSFECVRENMILFKKYVVYSKTEQSTWIWVGTQHAGQGVFVCPITALHHHPVFCLQDRSKKQSTISGG